MYATVVQINVITKSSLGFVWTVLTQKVDIWCLVNHLKISNVAIALHFNKTSEHLNATDTDA